MRPEDFEPIPFPAQSSDELTEEQRRVVERDIQRFHSSFRVEPAREYRINRKLLAASILTSALCVSISLVVFGWLHYKEKPLIFEGQPIVESELNLIRGARRTRAVFDASYDPSGIASRTDELLELMDEGQIDAGMVSKRSRRSLTK